MSKKIVLSTEVVERTLSGGEVIAVHLSDEALEGLSTDGAEIQLSNRARERPSRNSSTPPYGPAAA
jgi:hypothetical protein